MNKKLLLVSVLLLFVLLSAIVLAQSSRTRQARAAEPEQSPSMGVQFLKSGACIFTQCGILAILWIVLPVIGIYVYKKYISVF